MTSNSHKKQLEEIERKVFQAAESGDMETARWILERLNPSKWGTAAARLEHSGRINLDLNNDTYDGIRIKVN